MNEYSQNVTDDMFTSVTTTEMIGSASWLSKYAPSNFDNCLLKPDEKTLMDKWLKGLVDSGNNIEKKTKPKGKKVKNPLDTNCLFLYGPPGIGKTTIAKLLLKKYNYDVLEFNASDTRTAKTIQDKLNKVGGSHNVVDFMCNKKTKIAIILDEIDGLSNGDKGGMTEINSIIAESKEKKTPFICISNTVCKKTDALKRKSLFMKISKPCDANINKIINHINTEESLLLDDTIINSIVTKSQGDIRRCVTLLEYIFRNKQKEKDHETISIVDNYSRKLTELAPYEMCEKVLNSNDTLDFFLENFNFDHSMTNWYIYENFVKYIDKNRIGSFDKKVKCIEEIYDCFAHSDLIERDVVLNQNYEFYEYINTIKTCGGSFWANRGLKRSSYNKMGMMNYSTLLNRTSLEYSNAKNWAHVNNTLLCNQDTNITTDLCNIFYKNLEQDNSKFIKRFIDKYNVELDDIEKIIKMSIFYNKGQTQELTNLKKKIKLYYNSS
jgi:replication factor C subunit 1